MGVNNLPKTVTRQRRDCDLGIERIFLSKSQHMNIHTNTGAQTAANAVKVARDLAVHRRSHS